MGGPIEFPVKYGHIVVFVGVFAIQIGLPLLPQRDEWPPLQWRGSVG